MKNLKNNIGTVIGCALILVWCLLPVAWIVSLSFKSQESVTNGSPGFFPSAGGGAGWSNYADVLQDDQFRRSIINSIGISLIATILSVTLATLAAYAIARLEFKGKKFVLTTALVIAMFPVVSLVGPLFDMWRTIGIYDTWLGLIIRTCRSRCRSRSGRCRRSSARSRGRWSRPRRSTARRRGRRSARSSCRSRLPVSSPRRS